MEDQSSTRTLSGAMRRHARAARAVAGAMLAVSLVAWSQSRPAYDTGGPIYPGGAPAYDNTSPASLPLTAPALSALSRLQHIRAIVDRATDLSPARKAVALAEIDLAMHTLQNSNAPEAGTSDGSHPTYDFGGPNYGKTGPIYDNSLPRSPSVPSDRRSAAVALRELDAVIQHSSELSEDVRRRTTSALDAAAEELEHGR